MCQCSQDQEDQIRPEDRTCQNCRHWAGNDADLIPIRIAGSIYKAAQCLNEEDERAPIADTPRGGETAVFTRAENGCEAFAVLPAALEDLIPVDPARLYDVIPGRDFPATLSGHHA